MERSGDGVRDAAAADQVYGRTEPRLWTPPLRPLTRETTRGYEVIEFAELIGEPLLPWQQWAVIHALELLPDGSYRFRTVLILVARQNGKSTLKRVVSLWRMYMDGARLILGVAQDVSLAREQWNLAQDTIRACPELAEELDVVRRTNGDEWFRLTNGARYKIGAANRRAGRGFAIDELTFDELREQRNWDAWSALSKTTGARPRGQTWAMSNAGDDSSVVLNQLRDAGISGREGIGLFEWSAPDGCELDDVDALAQANPSLGYARAMAAIRADMSDPPAVFRTEVLCQRVDQLDGAFDLAKWATAADTAGTLPGSPGHLYACVEVSEDHGHVTLAVAAPLDDDRVRVAVAKAWDGLDDARAELPNTLAAIRPAAVAWFPTGPTGALATMLRPKTKDEKLPCGAESIELSGNKVSEASMGFAALISGRKVLHPDDPLINAHLARATPQPTGDGWRVARPEGVHVDAAYATLGATHAALTAPAAATPRIRMIG